VEKMRIRFPFFGSCERSGANPSASKASFVHAGLLQRGPVAGWALEDFASTSWVGCPTAWCLMRQISCASGSDLILPVALVFGSNSIDCTAVLYERKEPVASQKDQGNGARSRQYRVFVLQEKIAFSPKAQADERPKIHELFLLFFRRCRS